MESTVAPEAKLSARLPGSVRTAWHLAALARSVRPGRALPVMVAGTPIALFRTTAGIAAVVDRCPHRNYPLSEGRVVRDAVECPYHGWRFAADGSCVTVPGCQLAEGQGRKLAARPLTVVERHGGVFVNVSDEGTDAPDLPPLFGAAGYDHFWWDQGVWQGRAFDAIENVLDPFHTNYIHDGFIRRNDKRMPVLLEVNTFARGIEMVIRQTAPDLGLMSRFLEADRSHSVTRYYPPTTVQARWEGKTKLTLCVTAFFTPAEDATFRPFACFTTPAGALPGWVKEAAIRLFLGPVVRQDRIALERQSAVVKRFGAPRYIEGPGDLLGNRVHRLYAGDTLVPGRDAPAAVTL